MDYGPLSLNILSLFFQYIYIFQVFEARLSGGRSHMVIHNFPVENAGEYSCELQTDVGFTQGNNFIYGEL